MAVGAAHLTLGYLLKQALVTYATVHGFADVERLVGDMVELKDNRVILTTVYTWMIMQMRKYEFS